MHHFDADRQSGTRDLTGHNLKGRKCSPSNAACAVRLTPAFTAGTLAAARPFRPAETEGGPPRPGATEGGLLAAAIVHRSSHGFGHQQSLTISMSGEVEYGLTSRRHALP
jgi:hypothetical protein